MSLPDNPIDIYIEMLVEEKHFEQHVHAYTVLHVSRVSLFPQIAISISIPSLLDRVTDMLLSIRALTGIS